MERGEDSTKAAFAEAYRKLQSVSPSQRITVKDIAAAAGYDRHTFYYHFKGIQDLVSWLFDTEVARIVESSAGNWNRVIPDFIDYADRNRALILALYHSPKHADTTLILRRKMGEMLNIYLSSEPAYSHLSELKRRIVATFIAGGAVTLFDGWLMSGMERSPDVVSAEILDTVQKSLAGFQSC